MARTSKENNNISAKDMDMMAIIDGLRDNSKETAKVQQDAAKENSKETIKIQQETAKKQQDLDVKYAKNQEDLAKETASIAQAGKSLLKDLKNTKGTPKNVKNILKNVPKSIKDTSSNVKSITPNTSNILGATENKVFENLNKFALAGLTKGSLFTHDIHVVSAINSLVSAILGHGPNVPPGPNSPPGPPSPGPNGPPDPGIGKISNIFDGIKNMFGGLKNVFGDIANHLDGTLKEVLGPLAEYYELTKGLLKNVGSKLFGTFLPKKEDAFYSAGLNTGSIYTHDIHLEKLLENSIEVQEKMYKSISNNAANAIGLDKRGMVDALGAADKKDPSDEKSTGYLSRMSAYFKRQEKSDAREEDGKKKDGGLLGGLRLGVGGLLNPKMLGKLGIWAMLGLMIKDMIKGWIKGETLEDKAILGLVGLLTIPGAIMEWAVNGILGLFGSDFKVDFSPKALEKGIRDINKWIFDNITAPVMDFFTKTIPEKFDIFIKFFKEDIPNFFNVTIPAKIEEAKTYIKDNILKPIGDWFANIGKEIYIFMKGVPIIGDVLTGIEVLTTLWKKSASEGKDKTFFDVIIDFFENIGKWIADWFKNSPLGKSLKKIKDLIIAPKAGETSDETSGMLQSDKLSKEETNKLRQDRQKAKERIKRAKGSGFIDTDDEEKAQIKKDEALIKQLEAKIQEQEKRQNTALAATSTMPLSNASMLGNTVDMFYKQPSTGSNEGDVKLQEDTMKAQGKMAEQSTTKGSLYTHDIYILDKLDEIFGVGSNIYKNLGDSKGIIIKEEDDLEEGLVDGISSSVGNSVSRMVSSVKSFFTPKKSSKDIDWSKKGLEGLGIISKKYETGGRGAGTVSSGKGDYGGVSYGSYQMASRGGQKSTASQFIKNSKWSDQFEGMQAGTKEFSEKWKETAAENAEEFEKAQHEYIKETHFNPLANKVKEGTGLDVSKRSKALQEAIWSVSVQHGGNTGLVNKSLSGMDANAMNDKDILTAINKERTKETSSGELAYFESSSTNVQAGLRKRFTNEHQDQQNLLASTDGNIQTAQTNLLEDSVKKPGGKIETAQADMSKAKQEVYLKDQEVEAKRDQNNGEMTRVMKESSMKQDKYQSDMSNKQSGGNNIMMAGGSGGGGGGGANLDIPEFIDNYLLGLTVSGVLS